MASSWSKVNGDLRHRLRIHVLGRDRGVCHLCGLKGADTVDHLVPRSRGGSDHPSNLAAAHAWCNTSRSDTPMTRPIPSRRY